MAYRDEERARDEQSRRERIQLDKVKQGQMENVYAREKENEPPAPPMTGAQKRENFWYHYKGRVIGAVAAVLIVGFFVYDIVTKPKYDTSVVVAANSAVTLYQEQVEQTLAQYGTDRDGDGAVRIGAAMLTIKPKDDPASKNEYAIANKAALVSVLTRGDHLMMLLDDAAYTHIKDADEDAFVDLSAAYPKNKHIKGDRYFIKGTRFAQTLKEKKAELPETLSISILKLPDSSKLKAEQAENEKYVNALLRALIERG